MGYCTAISRDSALFATYVGSGCNLAGFESLLRGLDHPLLMSRTWPRPYDAAMAVTGDIDCLTLGDFLRRFREG